MEQSVPVKNLKKTSRSIGYLKNLSFIFEKYNLYGCNNFDYSYYFCLIDPQTKLAPKMATTMQDSKIGDCIFLTPRVPQGLAAAVEGLTREVIRHRPDNIYVFAAHHFEKLLHLREQYGNNNNNNNNNNNHNIENKKNMKILHEMNEAIKERNIVEESKETRNFIEHSGWSLSETAKVLERHRSIFGESGQQKISTEEIRELAKNEVISSTNRIQETSSRKKCEKHSSESKNFTEKYKSKKMESPRLSAQDQADHGNYDPKGAPKIISQIPLTKDIKTELKKNRISSRERKKYEEKRIQVACEYSRETTIEKTSRKSIEKTKRSSYESRTEHRKSSRTEESVKKKLDSKDEFSKERRSSIRSESTDNVKNYVSQNFSGITNLEELQTPSYVEKVQEVIDETSTVIKEKVEALKASAMKAQHLKKERKSNEDLPTKSGRRSQEDSSPESSSSSSRSSRNGRVTKTEVENPNEPLDQSEAAADSKISLPAVRPPSSKSTSRSVSARSDYDGLVLPPISPESTKSPKPKEDLVLPVLSPPHSAASSPDDVPLELADDNMQRLEVGNEEVFLDSLNVTPEVPGAPQRPDSLENSETIDGSEDDSSGHVSPSHAETLKDKLLEIEEVQKRIENVLDDTSATVEQSDVEKSGIQEKLREIEESEKRIEKILDSSQKSEETINDDIKNKLQQLEEVERRINDILVVDANEEQPAESSKSEKPKERVEERASQEVEKDIEGENNGEPSKNLDVSSTDREDPKKGPIAESSEAEWVYSPRSYILTEGSPYDIPDTVTTVIIPDRVIPTPSDELEESDEKSCSTFVVTEDEIVTAAEKSIKEGEKIREALGETLNVEKDETSTVDTNYIRGIKASHDMLLSRQDLGLIKEERDTEEVLIDSEDEKVLRVVTTSLEEILENDKVEYVSKEEVISPKAGQDYESTDETKETSVTDGFLETVENSLDRSAESTNEVKETSITDRSSLSYDPGVPIVPELNLDSLSNMTVSSFNFTDDELREAGSRKESKESSLLDTPDGVAEVIKPFEESTGRDEKKEEVKKSQEDGSATMDEKKTSVVDDVENKPAEEEEEEANHSEEKTKNIDEIPNHEDINKSTRDESEENQQSANLSTTDGQDKSLLVDQQLSSSQCTRPDDLSIDTNIVESPPPSQQNNQDGTKSKEEGENTSIDDDKSLPNDSRKIDSGKNEMKIDDAQGTTSSTTSTSTLLSAATKIQAGNGKLSYTVPPTLSFRYLK